MSGPVVIVGENSVLQKTCTLERLIRGEVNRIDSEHISASGKGMNVSLVLSALDVESVLFGYAGGENGRRFETACRETGIDARITRIQQETRQCMTIIEPDGTTTEIVEPSPSVSTVESATFRDAVFAVIPDASLVCICGTAAGHEPNNAYYDIVREAKMLSVPIILDAHKKHGTKAIEAAPDFLKINEHELAEVHSAFQQASSSDGTTRQERERMARDLIATFGINIVIVTRGKLGAEAYDSHGWASAVSSITSIANPIGCGDAFTAALAHKLGQDGSEVDTAPPLASLLRHGVTVATAHGLSMTPGHLDTSNISRVARTILVSGSERTTWQ